MVTIKKDTIKTAKFETEMRRVVKCINNMEKLDKNSILVLLRGLQDTCVEWVKEEKKPKDFCPPF